MRGHFKKTLFHLIFFHSILFSQVNDCSSAQDPSRIIIAGGSITEIMYFIEAEEKIIGLDVT